MGGVAGGIAGAVLGGIAGGQRDSVTNNQTSGMYLAPESELSKLANKQSIQNLTDLQSMVGAGAGQQDVERGLSSQRSLADLLQSYSQGGYAPTEQDIGQAGTLADQLFAPSFRQQETEANRLSARLGRPINDPIIQARLRQGQAEQRGTFIAQQAQQMPLQRLGFAAQLADVRGNLASQAMSNRQAILGLGQNILGGERNYQMGTAMRFGNVEQQSGGGFGGMLSGAIGGAGIGAQGGTGIGSLFAGFGQKPQGQRADFNRGGFGSYTA